MNKFEFFDDLDAPLMGIIVDPLWHADNMHLIDAWLKEYGGSGIGSAGMFHVPSEEVKTLFVMRWA